MRSIGKLSTQEIGKQSYSPENMKFDKLKKRNKTINLNQECSNRKESMFKCVMQNENISNFTDLLFVPDDKRLDFQLKMKRRTSKKVVLEKEPECDNLLDCLIIKENRPITTKSKSEKSFFSKPKSKKSSGGTSLLKQTENLQSVNEAGSKPFKRQVEHEPRKSFAVSENFFDQFSTNNSKKSKERNVNISISNISKIESNSRFNNKNLSSDSFYKSTEALINTNSKKKFKDSSSRLLSNKKVKFFMEKAKNSSSNNTNCSSIKVIPKPAKKYSTDTVLFLNRQNSNAVIFEDVENENNVIPSSRCVQNFKKVLLNFQSNVASRNSVKTDNLTNHSKLSMKKFKKCYTYDHVSTRFDKLLCKEDNKENTAVDFEDDSSNSSIMSRYKNLIAKESITNHKLIVKCKNEIKKSSFLSPKVINRVGSDSLQKEELQRESLIPNDYQFEPQTKLPKVEQKEILSFEKPNKSKMQECPKTDFYLIKPEMTVGLPKSIGLHQVKTIKKRKLTCFSLCF